MDGPCWLSHGWGVVIAIVVVLLSVAYLIWIGIELADFCWTGEWGHSRKFRRWERERDRQYREIASRYPEED
jgi:hypothetical protein